MSIFNAPWWSAGAVIIALVVVVWILWRARREVSLADATASLMEASVSLAEVNSILAANELADAKLKEDIHSLTVRLDRIKEIQAANMKEKTNDSN